MADQSKCPQCGAGLPQGGLCLNCLLRLGIAVPLGEEIELRKDVDPPGRPSVPLDGNLEGSGIRIGHYTLLQKLGEGGNC
jgi:hypothetical protein